MILVFDLDGTIIYGGERVPGPSSCRLLADLDRSGQRVVIATGRMLVSARECLAAVPGARTFITYNGALVCHQTAEGLVQVVAEEPLPVELVRHVRAVLSAMDPAGRITLLSYRGDHLIASRPGELLDEYEHRLGIRAEILPLDQPHDFPSLKLLAAVTPGEDALLDRLQQALQPWAGMLTMARSKPNYLEINRAGVNKGVALTHLASVWPGETIVAFGDGENDLPLFAVADVSFAVGDAPVRVRERAGHYVGAGARSLRRAIRQVLRIDI